MMRSTARFVVSLMLFGLFSAQAQSASIGGWNPEALEDAQATVARFRATDPGLEKFFERAHGFVRLPQPTRVVSIGRHSLDTIKQYLLQ